MAELACVWGKMCVLGTDRKYYEI
jgi:arginine exporter protein ArgO